MVTGLAPKQRMVRNIQENDLPAGISTSFDSPPTYYTFTEPQDGGRLDFWDTHRHYYYYFGYTKFTVTTCETFSLRRKKDTNS
jgi:hypothetical protein